jgi:RNA polymerase sigma-70 factor (ECF subfamily)
MAAAVRGRIAVPYALGTATSDGLSWDELVAVVHRQMRSLAGPSRDLEDLTQVALEQVVRSTPRFRGDAELTTFTYKVCVHVVMNQWRWWRRWALRFHLGPALTEPADTRSSPAHLVIERERAERLYACLERLSAAKRVVLTLHDLEELPASRVAEIVGCPEPTVRSRLRKARRELAELLRLDPAFDATEAEER